MVKSGQQLLGTLLECVYLYTGSTRTGENECLTIRTSHKDTDHMLPTATQKRCRFSIFDGFFALWHVAELPLVHSLHSPSILFSGILKESLIIFEGPATGFRGVGLLQFKLQEKWNGVVTYPCPPTSKKIRHDKDQKEQVFEVIESHRRE